jgi:hypothetical protein
MYSFGLNSTNLNGPVAHSAVQQLEPNAESIDRAADPALIKGAGLERWWMDVQESVRPEE